MKMNYTMNFLVILSILNMDLVISLDTNMYKRRVKRWFPVYENSAQVRPLLKLKKFVNRVKERALGPTLYKLMSLTKAMKDTDIPRAVLWNFIAGPEATVYDPKY